MQISARTAFILLAGCLQAADPSVLPRTEICLNGAWDTVLNADGDQIPAEGWTPRRAPAMPIATRPPATSIWYPPGEYRLIYAGGAQTIHARPQRLPIQPGYDYVQRLAR